MVDIHPIKAYRKAHTLSQEQLAKQLGVTRLTVTRWETGERKVKASLIPSIADKTGLTVRQLRPDLFEAIQ